MKFPILNGRSKGWKIQVWVGLASLTRSIDKLPTPPSINGRGPRIIIIGYKLVPVDPSIYLDVPPIPTHYQ